MFRLSAHGLKIETGRYNSKSKFIPPEDRLYTVCDMNICENEMHFLLECKACSGE